jgi:flavodoxin
MKKMMFLAASTVVLSGAVQAQSKGENLIAYFSWGEKTVVPFCTHGGGRWGRSLGDLKKLCPDATVLEGLAISGNLARRSKDDVIKWLQKIEITKN